MLAFDQPRARHGVNRTRVIAASVDRLESAPRTPGRSGALRPGEIDAAPVARSRRTRLHLGIDHDGTASLVFRGRPDIISDRFDDLRLVSCIRGVGFVTPSVRRHAPGELWIDRPPQPAPSPTPDAVDRYVRAALQLALADGIVIGTGAPRVLPDGRIGCIDVAVARQLDFDERNDLTELWCSLVLLDTLGVTDAAARLCGSRLPGLSASAERAVVSLAAEWTPVSLGLSLHHLSKATVAAGPRSEALVLLADELLHRLDLAHDHRASVDSLATPAAALELLHGIPMPA